MKKIKEIKISYWAAHLTTVVSVTMLLVLVGLIALTGVAASNTADEIKGEQQVSLIMADSVGNAQADSLMRTLLSQPFVRTAHVITKEQALADWNKATGDNVEEIAGFNFFTPEIEIYLRPEYASSDAVAKIVGTLRKTPGVDDVTAPDEQVLASMDKFFSNALLLLGGMALAMITISFVLINNTVLLTIYSRRFTIHTMQLVGATPGFIRRPFILSNMYSGLLAGVFASALLAAAISFVEKTQLPQITQYVCWGSAGIVMVGITVTGMAICTLAALIATNRYLHKDYDELFT